MNEHICFSDLRLVTMLEHYPNLFSHGSGIERHSKKSTSRMTGDCHVRFCERLRGETPLCLLGVIFYLKLTTKAT